MFHGEIRGALWLNVETRCFIVKSQIVAGYEENGVEKEKVIEESSEIVEPYEWLETNRQYVEWQQYWPVLEKIDELNEAAALD